MVLSTEAGCACCTHQGMHPRLAWFFLLGVNCRLLRGVCWLLLRETHRAPRATQIALLFCSRQHCVSLLVHTWQCQWVVVEVSEVSLYPYVLIALVSACCAAACSHPVDTSSRKEQTQCAPGMPLYGICAVIPAVVPCARVWLLLTVRMLGMPCCWRPPLLMHQHLGSVLGIRASQSAAFVVVHR